MTDHLGRITVVSFLLLSLPGRGAAQELTAGSKVRVTAPSLGLTEHRGILEWVRGDSLRVGERTIPLGATTRVEIGREVSNFARFSLIGLAGGAALAGIVCLNECPSNDSDIGKGGFMFLYSAVGAAGGLAIGAVTGALTHRTEWKAVSHARLGLTVAPTPGDGLTVGLTVRHDRP